MKNYEKEVLQSRLDAEEAEMKHLKAIYGKATKDITKKIEISNGKISVLLANWDDLSDEEKSIYQSQIYQRNFQQSLKNQIDDFMKELNSNQYKSITDYMKGCYENGFIGAMYSIQKQGIPLIMPMDQKKIVKAMFTDSKISKKLYTKLGEDVNRLKKRIANNLSRGIATASSYSDIARNIASASNVGFNNAMRIARTEGARISNESAFDASKAAKDKGCDVVKMWSAALDGRTRPHHRQLDGQIRELDEPFEVDGMEVMYPSGFGKASEDINCRCALLQRAKWALDEDELETLKKRAEFYGLDKTKDINDFKKKYLKAAEVPQPKVKKEYLTEKKLKQKITEADTEVAKLKDEIENDYLIPISKNSGFSKLELDKVITSPDMVMLTGTADQYKAVKAIVRKIDEIELQKIDWQAKLDKKLATKEIKKLKKEKIDLQDDLIKFQDDLSKQKVKTYSGIWKNDVTTAEFGTKQGGIDGKKQYFKSKISLAANEAEKKKWQKLLDDTIEFEKEGAKYYALEQKINKAEHRISQIDKDVVAIKKNGVKSNKQKAEAFSQERKDNALWFDQAHGGFAEADKYFDPQSKAIHAAASKRERNGFYTYTAGSGGHNRPLAGFQKPWSAAGSGWEEEYFVGAKKVWIDYEGKGEDIRGLTSLIQKSTYDKDVWLQSGQNFQTIEAFLEIPYGSLSNMTDEDFNGFIGKRNVIYNFISSAVNKGGGSIFNSKPLKINFYAPEGTQMLYASDVGAFGKGENEMILQRGGTYEITKMYWGKDHTDGGRMKIFVDMEIHPEEGYDLFQQDPKEWTGSTKNFKSG